MHLTDPNLIVLLALLTFVTFVLLVAGWPRWRSGALRGATRAVQGTSLSLLAVSVCAVALNNQYLFYSSWDDLFTSGSPSVTQHHGGGAAGVVSARVKGPGVHDIKTPTAPAPLPQAGARMQN